MPYSTDQGLWPNGLLNEVKSPLPDTLHGFFDTSIAGNNDDLGSTRHGLDVRGQRHAVGIGEMKIHNDGIKVSLLNLQHGRLAGHHAGHTVPLRIQDLSVQFDQLRIVINNEQV